ncbi:23S rRNA (uracil(1939)-C(5))-methyltransferase RlmD [Paenibacillus ginsengarvi]|uniref:23S rRNA (Uracil(1939)-C(5))-methyltransferase RlmD n=1 Tax=Paenibacillus ginsengarvi TaxID=400777 RepID=A0A3B0CEY3_9BACL|nr:23S rRNA (uracil(1939)-C(5))-methyltransferase RlmD [Paenibacillus ginsengarvi]RKN84042.1 23S rRNA (uracil(1939)-C(5))-methyltransferase RlmD [Paenibacillus ginsengarvi]
MGGTTAAAISAPVAREELVVADVVGIGHEGEGVGRVNGFTLFIRGALPGERVRARVTGLKKQYGFAELLEVLEPSPDRVEPPCPVYDECGGCQLQHLGYEAQLRLKRQLVADNMERIGKLRVAAGTQTGEGEAEGVIVHPTIGMPDPWRYRNKVQVPIGEQEGGLAFGFYATGSHRIVDSEQCLIRSETADELVSLIKQMAAEAGIPAYDAEKRQNGLRHVIIKTGFHTGETMVVLVTDNARLPGAEQLAKRIAEAVPGVKSICHNVNDGPPGTVMGPRTSVLWGSDRIYDTIGDVRFAISANSFYQVNPVQTEALYGKALEYAGLTGGETVIDAYCGVGTISLFLAQRAKRVYGVELVPEAIEDARRNAELNGIANATFEAGPAETVIPRWREEGIRADVIVVDPPRKGCDATLLETIVAMRPQRVVYVSCNPSTLARDLRVLEDGGFRTVEVQPVDMFPWTGHVECCVLLVRTK